MRTIPWLIQAEPVIEFLLLKQGKQMDPPTQPRPLFCIATDSRMFTERTFVVMTRQRELPELVQVIASQINRTRLRGRKQTETWQTKCQGIPPMVGRQFDRESFANKSPINSPAKANPANSEHANPTNRKPYTKTPSEFCSAKSLRPRSSTEANGRVQTNEAKPKYQQTRIGR